MKSIPLFGSTFLVTQVELNAGLKMRRPFFRRLKIKISIMYEDILIATRNAPRFVLQKIPVGSRTQCDRVVECFSQGERLSETSRRRNLETFVLSRAYVTRASEPLKAHLCTNAEVSYLALGIVSAHKWDSKTINFLFPVRGDRISSKAKGEQRVK